MKKILRTLCFFLFCGICYETHAQVYLNWQQFVKGSAAKNDLATAIEVMDDEVMISGKINNTGTNYDALISKFSPDGILEWSGTYISANPDEVQGFQCNGYDEAVAIGSTGKTSNPNGLIFKLNDEGKNVWSKTFNGSYNGEDRFEQLQIGADNSIVAVGETMISSLICNGVIVVYDQLGNLLWKKTFGASGENEFNNVKIDAAGNIFASGYISNGINRDGYIAKYNKNGKLLKSVTINGAGNKDDEVKAIELGTDLLYAATVARGNGEFDMIVVSVYKVIDLSLVWSQTYASQKGDLSIAGTFQFDTNGNLLLSGIQDDGLHTAYLALSYKAASGALNWARPISRGSGYNNNAVASTIDKDNNFIITGATMPVPTAVNAYSDIFTVALDSKGDVIWTKVYDGISKKNDSPSAIGVNSKGNIFIAGQSQLVYEQVTNNDIVLLKYSTEKICYIPTGLSETGITNSSAKLSWDAMPEAVKYKVRYRPKGGAWIYLNSNSTAINVTGLKPGILYDWQVKTICTLNPLLSSGYAAVKTFTTLNGLKQFDSENNIAVNNSRLQLSPNPAHETIKLELKTKGIKNYTINIADVTGRILQVKQLQGNVYGMLVGQLDVASLLPGSYRLTVIADRHTYSGVFIKE